MPAYLVLPDGDRVEVRDGLVLGRIPPCDVVLQDSKASRKHARLHVSGDVVELEDLGSSNGTLLNGKRVRKRLLRPGDEIRIGTTSIEFRVDGAAPAAAPAGGPEPGEDLFGEEPDAALGAGLEGDPMLGDQGPAIGAVPTAAPREVPPADPPLADPPPADPPPADPQSPAAASNVEVLEFADDEVVEVRHRQPPEPPAAAAPTGLARGGRRGAAGAPSRGREHGVLRFAERGADRGLVGDDLRQMSAAARWAMIAAAVVAAVGLGYLAMVAVR
ncbi:MAG: FHA domain-containing protein [Planctomycetota bacterium]